MTREKVIKLLRQFIHQFDGRDVEDEFIEDVLESAADMLEQDAKTGWINVKDRLPEDGMPVIVLCQLAHHPGVWYRAMEFTTHKSHMWHDGTARYWFPLPETPKEATK